MTDEQLHALALELIRPQLEQWLREFEQEATTKEEQDRAA